MPYLQASDPAERLELAYLYPDGSEEEIRHLAVRAKEVIPGVSCRAAVVHAGDLQYIVPALEGTSVRPTVVIDFPDGLGGFRAKKDQARFSMQCGVSNADVVVNLRQVSARNMGGITAELLAVREYIPHIKLIAQVPYLWQTDQEAILWLLDLLPKAGVSCIKDWTGKRTFSVPVDTTVAVRTDYTNFIARHIILNNLPLAIKIAGEVDALNAGAFVKAGADFLGVSYQRAKSVRGALL